MMRALFSSAALLALGACGAGAEPDLAACETFVKRDMVFPESFERLAVSRVDDEPTDNAAFIKRAGLVKPPDLLAFRELWNVEQQIYDGSRIALRQMTLDYRFKAGSGEYERTKAVCAFRLVDGELPSSETLERAAKSRTREGLDTLMKIKGMRPLPAPRFDCCL